MLSCKYYIMKFMKQTHLKYIAGGVKPKEQCKKLFISSYITNTRLMGVMGIYIRWEVLDCQEYDQLSQFFLLDTEEFGLERFENIWGNDREKIYSIENSTIGCLGGKKVELTEEEACFMVQYFHHFNIEHKLPLPKNFADYKFILDKPLQFDEKDFNILKNKFCKKLDSDYEAINYCLMRIFGGDKIGASYVTDKSLTLKDLNIFPDMKMGTFHKNTITPKDDYYLCESLVSVDNYYYICNTKVKAKDFKVTYLQPIGNMRISSREAALILSSNEYILLYNLKEKYSDIVSMPFEVPENSTCSHHGNGDLFMLYKKHNRHVDNRVYKLSNDIYGAFFITDSGQFIISAHTKNNVLKLQRYFENSCMCEYMQLTNQFAFHDPILYDFIDSNYDDFREFLKLIDIK